MFGLDPCRYSTESPPARLFSYEGLILAPTTEAYNEYQRVGAFYEPSREKNYLEQAKFVTLGDGVQDTPEPVNGRQLVTIV